MVPKNSKKGTILVCRACGHEIKKFTAKKYQIREDVSRGRKDILIIEEERRKTTEEQRKYLTDLYGTETYASSEE
jgi:DNA-directed RNA polymerase subunit M/transcription elongation factor TFIIS